MTHHNDLVPTSSHLVPTTRDDVRNRPRPSSPSPPGDEVELRVHGEVPKTTTTSSPGRAQFNPGTTWLITTRTKPAWTAVYKILSDGAFHTEGQIFDAMRAASNLAPRTIENHLRSATRRRWIIRRADHIALAVEEDTSSQLWTADQSAGASYAGGAG